MRTHRIDFGRWSRRATLAFAVGASTALAGCGDWLTVTNPGAIENPALENPDYIQLMLDGVLGDFQPAYAWTALFSGAFTDELRMHHAYFENLEIDRREVTENNGTYALSVFNGLHRARFLADSTAGRIKGLLGDTASRDLRLAKAYAYAGYAWTLLGEQICETRINAKGPALQPDAQFAEAIARFDAAIAAAQVAQQNAANITDAAARARMIAGADSVMNMARVGGARAALNLSAYDPTKGAVALSYAQAVTPPYVSRTAQGFRYDAYYRDGASFSERRRIGNPFWEFVTAGRWVSLSGSGFENLNDPRLPHTATPVRVADGTNRLLPLSASAFSTYNGDVAGAPFAATSSIRLASALEARYVMAEVGGNTAANVTFLNERRAIGGQAPLSSPDNAAYMAALRQQRARDFFMDAHRLGDLRRYEKKYGVDLWPSGLMYESTTVSFGSQKCWPTPVSELF